VLTYLEAYIAPLLVLFAASHKTKIIKIE